MPHWRAGAVAVQPPGLRVAERPRGLLHEPPADVVLDQRVQPPPPRVAAITPRTRSTTGVENAALAQQQLLLLQVRAPGWAHRHTRQMEGLTR